MKKRSKNYRKALESFETEKKYSVEEAMEILEKFPKSGFDQSVEVHVNLEIDPSKTDQSVRGTVVLPHGTGKTKKIAVFTTTQEKEAKKAGADIISGEELVKKIETKGVIDFDVAVATPEMMPKLAKLAKVLGPKGLMPNPKTETVGPKVESMIEGLKKGKASFKNDKGGSVHQMVGKISFGKDKLKENVEAFISELEKSKPKTVKGKLIKSATVTLSMSPSVKIKA